MVGENFEQANFMERCLAGYFPLAGPIYRDLSLNGRQRVCLDWLKNYRTRYAADGNQLFAQHHLADTTITSNYGLDSRDRQIIRQQKSVKQVDFGYLQDSTIDQTKQALRIFSQTNGVSSWQMVSGHLPRHDNEIASATC